MQQGIRFAGAPIAAGNCERTESKADCLRPPPAAPSPTSIPCRLRREMNCTRRTRSNQMDDDANMRPNRLLIHFPIVSAATFLDSGLTAASGTSDMTEYSDCWNSLVSGGSLPPVRARSVVRHQYLLAHWPTEAQFTFRQLALGVTWRSIRSRAQQDRRRPIDLGASNVDSSCLFRQKSGHCLVRFCFWLGERQFRYCPQRRVNDRGNCGHTDAPAFCYGHRCPETIQAPFQPEVAS
ncbi:hypothetical protein ABIC08_008778 [Bradyrhizobium sp. RT9b]